jgi:iron complex outermembrane recepter protein
MPEVVVTAKSDPSLTVPDLETKREELAKIPGAAEVINADSYKRGRSTTIRDALDFAPGVFVQPRFGAEEARISIRGSGIQRTFHGRGIELLQDGVPLNLADGSFDFQAVEPLATRYIEVYRGANSLQFGSTTLGGALNFVSFTGYDASPLTARVEYGSFQSFRAQLSSGMMIGSLDYYVSLTIGFTDGYREHSEQANFRIFSNVGYRPSEEVETRFYFTYVLTDSELPGALTKEQMEDDPRQAAQTNVINNWKRDFYLVRLANKTVWERGDHRLELAAFWSYKDLDHPIFVVIDQLSNDFGLSLRYDNSAEIFGHQNKFTIGFNPTYGSAQDDRYLNILGNRGMQISDSDQYSLNLNLFIQDRFYITNRFALVAGTAITYARRQNVDNFPVSVMDPDNSGIESYWGFSPQVGLLYDITDTAQAFFNVSRSFEPPTFGELGNPADAGAGIIQLDAQTATTIEAGTRGQAGRVKWDLAYYFSWLENELIEFEVLPGLTKTINAGRTAHQGIECGLDIDVFQGILCRQPAQSLSQSGSGKESVKEVVETPLDRIVLRQVGLWNDFRFVNDPSFGNNRLPGIPPFYCRAELLYEHPCGFYAGPNVEWVPFGYNVDSTATLFADPYALLGFKVGYRSRRGLAVFFEAKNITNANYAATTGVTAKQTAFNQAQFFPGDGTAFYGGVEWDW